MNYFMERIEFLAAIPALPGALYVCVYMVLRMLGKLSVNSGGWHAASVQTDSRVVLSALGLFSAFQPAMRREAALRNILACRRGASEAGVSEVVVEFVPIG